MLRYLFSEIRINKKLLFYKAHYALFLGGLGCITPFLPLVVKDYGISAEVSGIIYTILPFIGLIARPVISVIADKFDKQKWILIASLLIVLILIFSINFIPPLEFITNESTFITCNGTDFDMNVCNLLPLKPKLNQAIFDEVRCLKECIRPPSSLSDDPCFDRMGYIIESNHTDVPSDQPVFELKTFESINVTHFNSCLTYRVTHPKTNNNSSDSCNRWSCNENETDSCVRKCFKANETATTLYRTYQFWWLSLAIIVKGINMEMVNCVGDAVTYNFLGNKREDYGKQRVGGSIGWGLMIIVSSYLMDLSVDDQGKTNYSIAFYMFLAFMLLDAITIMFMDINGQESSKNLLGDAIGCLQNAKGVLFISAVFIAGLMTGVYETFFFWYLEDLHSSKLIMGVARGISCFGGEIPFMIFSGIIIKNIGHFNAISLGLIAYAVRYTIYSVLTKPWHFLPVEVLSGLCFGVFYPAATGYASAIAPPGLSTTLQGIVSAVLTGAGTGVGSLIGGVLYKEFGGAITFRSFGLVSLVSGLLLMFFTHILQRQQIKKDAAQSLVSDSLPTIEYRQEDFISKQAQTPTIIIKFVKSTDDAEDLKNFTNDGQSLIWLSNM